MNVTMNQQERATMIKEAMQVLAQHQALDTNAKKRGIKSLKQAYAKIQLEEK